VWIQPQIVVDAGTTLSADTTATVKATAGLSAVGRTSMSWTKANGFTADSSFSKSYQQPLPSFKLGCDAKFSIFLKPRLVVSFNWALVMEAALQPEVYLSYTVPPPVITEAGKIDCACKVGDMVNAYWEAAAKVSADIELSIRGAGSLQIPLFDSKPFIIDRGCMPGPPTCQTGIVCATCPQHCKEGKCLLPFSLQCQACEAGWAGQYCDQTCGSHCKSNQCTTQKEGGCMYGCEDGWWGRYCDQACPSHCGVPACDRIWGTCPPLNGCQGGWWGPTCNTPCAPRQCRDGFCMPATGMCIACTSGWCSVNSTSPFGPQDCLRPCSTTPLQ